MCESAAAQKLENSLVVCILCVFEYQSACLEKLIVSNHPGPGVAAVYESTAAQKTSKFFN